VADETWRRLLGEAHAAVTAGDPESAPGGIAHAPGGIEVDAAADRLGSPFPVQDMAVACIGAALAAAGSLHERRTGNRPGLRLAADHAAAAVRSEALMRRGGEPAGPGFAPLSRFWPAADGWVRTHGNYPWHRAALLRASGAADDRPAAVGAAIARMPARELEERVNAAGGVAVAVRSAGEWLQHPQGRDVAAGPLAGGRRMGGSGPRRVPSGEPPAASLPAAGLRVLDLTRVIAGPVCTRFLAALGADVLRLDPPHRPELPLHIRDGLIGKRSALLDAGTAQGSQRLHDLIADADVLVHGYRPGALDRFGLASPQLAERYPGLVVVSLTAWGSTGPWGDRRGFDSIVQAATGIAAELSPDGGRPGALPCQLLDHGTGYLCAAAVLDAVRRRADRDGTYHRELSLARTAHWLLSQPRRPPARPEGPAAGDGERWLVTVDSSDGPVSVVSPPGQIGGGRLGWPRALAAYGADPARW
jgi:crotonobetainyl-CoA:carnitine CoA-transferase CaiB-like acyl-CoA transferase